MVSHLPPSGQLICYSKFVKWAPVFFQLNAQVHHHHPCLYSLGLRADPVIDPRYRLLLFFLWFCMSCVHIGHKSHHWSHCVSVVWCIAHLSLVLSTSVLSVWVQCPDHHNLSMMFWIKCGSQYSEIDLSRETMGAKTNDFNQRIALGKSTIVKGGWDTKGLRRSPYWSMEGNGHAQWRPGSCTSNHMHV